MFLVTTIRDNVIEDILEFDNEEKAQEAFLELCQTNLSNFDEYTPEDIDAILAQGYETHGHGSICISNLGNGKEPKSNDELIKTAKVETDFSPNIKEDDEVVMEIQLHGIFHFSVCQRGLTKADIQHGLQDAVDECRKSIEGKGNLISNVDLTEMEAVIYNEED